MTKLSFQPEQLDKIRSLAKVGKERSCQFLGYTQDLKTGEFYDLLEKIHVCGRRLPISGFAKKISGDSIYL